MIFWLADLSPVLFWLILGVLTLGNLVALAVVPRILAERRDSAATLSWLFAIVFLPWVGLLAFWVLGMRGIRRVRLRRKSASQAHAGAHGRAVEEALARFSRDSDGEMPSVVTASMRLAARFTGGGAIAGNQVDLLLDGDATFAAMETAIRGARDHLHLLYYIYHADATGRRFRDLLVERARAGIAVRVLLDHVGSFSTGPDFFAPLTAAGGQVAYFLPVNRISARMHLNLRNHRKILVADGEIGFTGGINIGDEYTAAGSRPRRWRDTHARIVGPSVHRLQEIFAEDWHFATREDLVAQRYYPLPRAQGSHLVHVVSSGPDQRWETMQRCLFTAITNARRSVLITTPYFAPDQSVLVALETAALRGVEVKLLLPRRADYRLLDFTARSFFPELVEAGVHVYLYRAGMMHAKTAVVDGVWSTVGSANTDMRSFRLNFEANLVIYGEAFAGQLTAAIENDIAGAKLVTRDEIRRRRFGMRVIEGACRILAPIL